MNKFNTILFLAIFSLIITVACSGSPDVMDTAIDKQKELDAAYGKATSEMVNDAKAKADADAKTKADADAKAKADASKPIVKMINLSTKYSDQTLQALVDLSVSKNADRKSNIIAIAYDIGANKGNSITDMPFEEHEVLISKDQIKSTINTIRSFLENDECIKDLGEEERKGTINGEMERFTEWLEKGADATTQAQACATTRVVFNGAPTTQSEEDTLKTWVHELYHALQQDIALEPPAIDSWCDEEATQKSGWLIEGGADYFAQHIYAEYKGLNGLDQIFKYGLQSFNETGAGLYDGGIARTGAAALRLLVERGAVKHDSIIDGSLFQKCERVSVYHDNNPDVKIAKSSWSEIQYVYGKYSFKPSALK